MRRSRLGCLIVSMSLVGGATVAITTSMTASAAPSVVRLHLGSDSRSFSLGTVTQSLTVGRNSCAINSAEPLIDLSSWFASGNQSAPGFVTDGIGVKASPSSGNGSPCSQVDAAERLTIRPGTSLPGRTFSSLRLDVEMAGNAIVVLTLSRGATTETHKIVTGTSILSVLPPEVAADLTAPYDVQTTSTDRVSACAAPNSSGPNSAGNDNCRWTVTPTPGFNFDTVSLTTEIGTVALEGSGDFANDANFDSLFYLSNSAPVAMTDVVTSPEDASVTFNVLTNDTDGDGDTLSATILTNPTHGTVGVAALPLTGFTYTPAANYSGPDSFTYTVTDGTDSSTGTVNITVTPVNDAPVAVSGTSSTPEETTVILTVATDIDSAVLTSSCTSSEGGTIVDNGNGSVDFTPPLNFTGSTTILCSTSDSLGATTATSATVTVGVSPANDAPVANADSAEVNANDSVIINVVANDTDVDGDTLLVGGVATPPTSGIAVPTGGSITYTPDADFTGTDSFPYPVTDGTATSGAATVTITVHPVICSNETVSDTDGNVSGSFTRLNDLSGCKRYVLDASAAAGTVLFVPDGAAQVDYRGYLTFAPAAAPGGALNLSLKYDPIGGTTFQPVLVCIAPVFDPAGAVTSATLPAGESWCIASETTRGVGAGNAVTTWQVFGHDDPRFQ